MDAITGQGYDKAFTAAQGQFNTEEDRRMAAAKQAQGYGLDVLAAQRVGGETQRGIEQSGIAADLAQFEFERDYPQRQLQFMQSLLQGLPLETQSYAFSSPSPLQTAAGVGGDIMDIYARLFGNPAAPTTTTTGGTTTSAAGMDVGPGIQERIDAAAAGR
jgi:hypothetical protein